jgi:hypothetical protein
MRGFGLCDERFVESEGRGVGAHQIWPKVCEFKSFQRTHSAQSGVRLTVFERVFQRHHNAIERHALTLLGTQQHIKRL